ncbi:MAG: serine hydrolase domain-containing protein [Gemmatimonadaceae bacterium]
MIRRALLAPTLLVLTLIAETGRAQSASRDSASRWVDSIFSPVSSRQGPGCAVGVAEEGALTFAKGYGMADLEHDAPITPQTRFYLASLAKQFTAMSILLLAQDHRLSLDDLVSKWVPEVPSVASMITLRQLLHHTSGLRDYFTLLAVSGWPADGPLTEHQLLALVARQKSLNFQPGDEFLYSNTGYALLAIVVKRASGQSLREFADARIFRPLGMTHTMFRDDHTMLVPQRAIGYQPAGVGYRLSQPEFDVVGDGGMYSTVQDLAKWDENFTTGRVGGRSGIAEMERPGQLNDGQPIAYGFGLSIGTLHGFTTYSHGGAYGGYRTEMLRIPEKKLAVITLCNTSSASPTLAEQVSRVFLGVAAEKATVIATELPSPSLTAFGTSAPADSTGARQRNDRLALLGGRYYSDELDLSVTVAARDGVLVLTRPRAEELRFVPLAEDLFTNSDRMLLRVVRDANGGVTGLTLTVNRVRDLEFSRTEP